MARKSRKHLYDENCNSLPEEKSTSPIIYKAGAYVRLSGDDTKKRGDSIETQRNIIENYIAVSSDIQLIDVYTDNHKTGTNFERPGFHRMLTDAQSGKINCIIVKDISRFGRNVIDGGYYLEKYLPSLGVRFIAVTDQYDSNEPENALLLPLMNIINEAYALDIGRKVKAVHQENITAGRYVGRLAPYGYMKAPDDCHQLIPDPETAPVVKQLYEWAIENTSATEMARRLTEKNILTPARYNLAKGYDKTDKSFSPYWQATSVNKILSDRVYVGDMVQGKTTAVRGKTIINNPSSWTIVQNTHEPIIDGDIFERVQKIRQGIYDNAKAIQDNITPYTPNMFKGKVFCAHCGYHMRRHRSTKGGNYWFRCESQVNYGKNACSIVSTLEKDVIAKILKTIKKKSAMIFEKYANLDKDTTVLKDGNSPIDKELKEVERELGIKSRYLKGLYESLINEMITQDEFAQMKEGYEKEILELSGQANNLRSKNFKMNEEKAEYVDFAGAVKAALKTNRLTEEISQKLIEKIVVNPDKSFRVYYHFDKSLREAS